MPLCWFLVWLVLWDSGGREKKEGVVVRSGTLWLLLYCAGVIGVVDLVGGLFIDCLVVMVVVDQLLGAYAGTLRLPIKYLFFFPLK